MKKQIKLSDSQRLQFFCAFEVIAISRTYLNETNANTPDAERIRKVLKKSIKRCSNILKMSEMATLNFLIDARNMMGLSFELPASAYEMED